MRREFSTCARWTPWMLTGLVAACSDDAGSGSGGAGTGGSAGGGLGGVSAAGASGASAGAHAMGGSAAGAVVDAGTAGTAMAGASSGGSDAGAAGTGGTVDECPRTVSFPAPGQTFVIQSVNFVRDEVVLVNASSEELTLPGSWQWCSAPTYAPPTYGFITGADVVVPPGGTLVIDVPGSALTGATDLDLLAESGEFAVYNSTGGFQQQQNLESYVTWGEGGGGRENVASTAGRWSFMQRAAVEDGHAGIVGVGRADRASGYRSVPLSCL